MSWHFFIFIFEATVLEKIMFISKIVCMLSSIKIKLELLINNLFASRETEN